MSLDKFFILDRYSLLEAELWWFYYSLSLYIKQETQHGGGGGGGGGRGGGVAALMLHVLQNDTLPKSVISFLT